MGHVTKTMTPRVGGGHLPEWLDRTSCAQVSPVHGECRAGTAQQGEMGAEWTLHGSETLAAQATGTQFPFTQQNPTASSWAGKGSHPGKAI